MYISHGEKAEILTEALPYIQKYNNKIIVIKYGGSAMTDEKLKTSVMRDLVLLAQIGIKVVLVHGGGPEITETFKRMDIRSSFINGLRQTDKEAVEVVQMVLAGKVSKSLVNLIENAGGNAISLSGVDGRMFEATQISEELGYVGEISTVNTKPVLDLLNNGYIPVISSVGCDRQGNIYNINADNAASKLAQALGAYSLISMTDTKGILLNQNDESTLVREILVSETEKLISEGIVSGGMIPKIKCCADAVRNGVKQVFIIDGRVPHAIIIEVLSDEGIGTMFH
ncbi:MAG: acetylglutamate kinase [Christensenellaceae bacterium]|jgi:acetylglutamate kinase|nr:acetylglutamate kinase [Christensenellaceae bacterium]